MSGPKIFKARENLNKYRKKITEKYRGVTNLHFSNVILNLSEINSILYQKNEFEKKNNYKVEIINEDCYRIDSIEEYVGY